MKQAQRTRSLVARLLLAGIAACLGTALAVTAVRADDAPLARTDGVRIFGHCDTEPFAAPSKMIMTGDGWDGPGQNAVTITWRVENSTGDMGPLQRTAIINALQAWANVVQIDFVETAVANENVAIDFAFTTGNHDALEPQETGDGDCPFDGAGGVVAHGGFPPGVNSLCINAMSETFAGNIHFDDDDMWELDDTTSTDALFSLTFVACHEIGHAIGLTHSTGATDVMEAFINSDDAFPGLSAADITNIRVGYATGTGSVTTLAGSGVWVNWTYSGLERGTFVQPFNTIAEGIAGIPAASTGLILHMVSGVYTGAPVITKNMIIQPESGSVTLTQ
ncbi:MAG: matrixin family metalloprotease [bacterium]